MSEAEWALLASSASRLSTATSQEEFNKEVDRIVGDLTDKTAAK